MNMKRKLMRLFRRFFPSRALVVAISPNSINPKGH